MRAGRLLSSSSLLILQRSCWKPRWVPVIQIQMVSSKARESGGYQLQGGMYQQCRFLTKLGRNKDERYESEHVEEPQGDVPYKVYDGALKDHMKHLKIFSIVSSSVGLSMQPMIISSAGEQGMAATIAMLTMVGFFTYVTPVLIYLLTKRYVTEILYDPKTEGYLAETRNFFLMRRELIFHKDDVVVPDVPGPFTSIIVKKKEDGKQRPLFVALESFIYPRHYGLIMGYDKPLDLHLKPEQVIAAVEKRVKEKKDISESGKNT